MYYLTGKNVSETKGWSIVTQDGVVCCTIADGMGLMAALILCETLNDPNLAEKYKGRHDNKRICIHNYDDNKIIWDDNNVIILDKLYHSGIVNAGELQELFFDKMGNIDEYMTNLVTEGWVYDIHRSNHTDHNLPFLKEGEYHLTFMGKTKCEYLLNYMK